MVPEEVKKSIHHMNKQYTSGQLDNDELFDEFCTIVTKAELTGEEIKESLCLLLTGPGRNKSTCCRAPKQRTSSVAAEKRGK